MPGSRGAHAIAITDSMVSPLVQSADSVLIARSDMASIVDILIKNAVKHIVIADTV